MIRLYLHHSSFTTSLPQSPPPLEGLLPLLLSVLYHSSSPAKPKLVFHLLQPLIKLSLSVSQLCYHSKVTHSIISSLIQSNLPFYTPVPTDPASNMSWGKQRRMCVHVWVYLCVYGRVVTLWMTSFRGAINRACPWAVDLSYESSPERRQTEKIERKAFEGMYREGDVTECVMCVCIQFKSQIW